MQAQMKLKVEILPKKQAFELFCMKVGEETLSSHPKMPKLAEKMAMECKGLPLALIVVGSAMTGVKSVEVWEYSTKNLRSSSWTALDLETNVFSILKFSYDKLDEVQKHCFLYCALYPEDYAIRVSDLIDKWMWESFLCKDMPENVQDMRLYGESIIEKLKISCLLESVEDDIFMNRKVKMHDVIRDMALWIMHNSDKMELVQRTLIMNDWKSQKFQGYSNATTLVLFDWLMTDIKDMKRLRVLDLKANKGLFEQIGCFVSLEYLSLVVREILRPELLSNLEYLKKLKFLSLAMSPILTKYQKIPSQVLSSLQQLRVFRLSGCEIIDSEETKILEELESLPNIEELCIEIGNEYGVNKLLESTKLQGCICKLSIDVNFLKKTPLSLAFMSKMKQLQQIEFSRSNIRSEQYSFVRNTSCLTKLRSVTISECSIIHVTWLKYAPFLQQLYISLCESMEEVIKEEEAMKDENTDFCAFSSLVTLTLIELPILKSIHKTTLLSFPSLKSITIFDCPKLKKLPLDSNSAKQLTHVIGKENWRNNLEWDDSTAKDRFLSKF